MNCCQQCHVIKIIKILKIINIYIYTLYILPSAITCACLSYNSNYICIKYAFQSHYFYILLYIKQ